MAKLTSKERNRLPASEFGEPSKRKYPMEDRGHAAAAKSRASEMEHKGRISQGQERKIDRKADAVLSEKPARSMDRGNAHHANVKNAGTHHEKMRHG